MPIGLSASGNLKFLGKIVLPIAATLLATSCTVWIERPTVFTGDERVKGISYSDAVGYVNNTYARFQKGLRHQDEFDGWTKGGVALGVGGAGISAVFRSSRDLLLGLLSFGGLSYAGNQLVNSTAVGDVLIAGMSNLDCIDAAGAAAFQGTAATRAVLPKLRTQLAAASATLKKDKEAAGAANGSKYAADIGAAEVQLASTASMLDAIDKYTAGANVGEAMVLAVNGTITAVNQQARAKAPSIDAIAQSGSIFSSFIGVGANLRNQTTTALGQIKTGAVAEGVADVERDSVQKQLDADESLIKSIIADIPALDTSTVAQIANCKAQFATEPPVTVQPSGAITLEAGGSAVTLHVTGKAPVRIQWDGQNPAASDIQVSTNLSEIVLTASASAKQISYTLEIIDFAGKSSGPIQLSVTPAKATPPPATVPPATQQKQVPKKNKNPASPAVAPPTGPPPPPASH